MKYILPILIFFCSCSTLKKSKSSSVIEEKTNVVYNSDSSVKQKIDCTNVKKDLTVTTKETDGAYTKETVKEYKHVPDGIKAADYFPILVKETTKETGTLKSKEKEERNITDSTTLKKELIIVVTTTRQVTYYRKAIIKNKDVKRTSYWGWLWLLVPVAIYFIGRYFGWWKFIIAWWRKRNDDYPIRYKNYNPPKPPAV